MTPDETANSNPSHSKIPEGCTLAHAEANIRRSLRTSGPISEGERYGAEWRTLEAWCEAAGLIACAEVAPERVGGREHDLLSLNGEWLKFTKPWAAGYTVDVSASRHRVGRVHPPNPPGSSTLVAKYREAAGRGIAKCAVFLTRWVPIPKLLPRLPQHDHGRRSDFRGLIVDFRKERVGQFDGLAHGSFGRWSWWYGSLWRNPSS